MIKNTRQQIITMVVCLVVGTQGLVLATEPNEDFGSATPLPGGQTVVNDSLDGSAGRLDTLLGHFTPLFLSLNQSDDNSSKFGNGLASGLNGLPLEGDGSIFVAVTGVPNTSFNSNINSHFQFGSYDAYFDFYGAAGQFLETVVLGGESLQHDLDNLWIVGTPARVGGTVDVHIDNLIGLGDGDPIDFFIFNGLAPGQSFVAEITSGEFDSGLGWFDPITGELLVFDDDSGNGTLSKLDGIVSASGQVVLGVTGSDDLGFLGEHAKVGDYTLEVVAIPEPLAAVLLVLGGALGLLLVRGCRGD